MKGSNFTKTKYVDLMKIKCFNYIPLKKKSVKEMLIPQKHWNSNYFFSVVWENIYFPGNFEFSCLCATSL